MALIRTFYRLTEWVVGGVRTRCCWQQLCFIMLLIVNFYVIWIIFVLIAIKINYPENNDAGNGGWIIPPSGFNPFCTSLCLCLCLCLSLAHLLLYRVVITALFGVLVLLLHGNWMDFRLGKQRQQRKADEQETSWFCFETFNRLAFEYHHHQPSIHPCRHRVSQIPSIQFGISSKNIETVIQSVSEDSGGES